MANFQEKFNSGSPSQNKEYDKGSFSGDLQATYERDAKYSLFKTNDMLEYFPTKKTPTSPETIRKYEKQKAALESGIRTPETLEIMFQHRAEKDESYLKLSDADKLAAKQAYFQGYNFIKEPEQPKASSNTGIDVGRINSHLQGFSTLKGPDKVEATGDTKILGNRITGAKGGELKDTDKVTPQVNAYDKKENVIDSPKLENFYATAMARHPILGKSYYDEYTQLRKDGKLNSKEAGALYNKAVQLGKQGPEDKQFSGTVQTLMDGGNSAALDYSPMDYVTSGNWTAGIARGVFELSRGIGKYFRKSNDESQEEDFLKAMQGKSTLSELVNANLGRTAMTNTIQTDLVNKDQSAYEVISTTTEGLGNLAGGLASGDAQTWGDLGRGIVEDELGLIGFLASAGGSIAYTSTKTAIRAAQISKNVNRAQQIANRSMKAKIALGTADFMAESTASGLGGALPVALDAQMQRDQMNVGVANYVFANTLYEDLVSGWAMDGAGTAIKRTIWKPVKDKAVKGAHKALDKKLKEKQRAQEGVFGSFDEPVMDLVNKAAGLVTKHRGDGVMLSFNVKQAKVDNPINVADGEFLKMEDLEQQGILSKHYQGQIDGVSRNFGKDLSSYDKGIFVAANLKQVKDTYNSLGSTDKANPDLYKLGAKSEITIDNVQQFIYKKDGILHRSETYRPASQIQSVNTVELKRAVDNMGSSKGISGEVAFNNYIAGTLEAEAKMALYYNHSFNPETFSGKYYFDSELNTARQMPLDLTGFKYLDKHTIGVGTRKEQARARSLKNMGVDATDIEAILPGVSVTAMPDFPSLPLADISRNLYKRADYYGKALHKEKVPNAEAKVEAINKSKTTIADLSTSINNLFNDMHDTQDLKTVQAIRMKIDAKTELLVETANKMSEQLDKDATEYLSHTEYGETSIRNAEERLRLELVEDNGADIEPLIDVSTDAGFTKAELTEDLGNTLTHVGDRATGIMREEAHLRESKIDREAQEVKTEEPAEAEGAEPTLPDTEETHKTVEGEEAKVVADESLKEGAEKDLESIDASEDLSEAQKVGAKLNAEHLPEGTTPELAAAEAKNAIEEAKSLLPEGESFQIESNGAKVQVEHTAHGTMKIVPFDDNGLPMKEFSIDKDGKVFKEGNVLSAVNPKTLKDIFARRSIDEAGISEAFNIELQVLNDHPDFKTNFMDIVNEYRRSTFELIDAVRDGQFTTPDQMIQMKTKVSILKAKMFEDLNQVASDLDMPTQSATAELFRNRNVEVNHTAGFVDKLDRYLDNEDINTGALDPLVEDVVLAVQNLLNTGSRNTNRLDESTATKIKNSITYLRNNRKQGNFESMKKSLGMLRSGMKEFNKVYLSNAETQVDLYDNNLKSKAFIVQQRDMSAKGMVLEDNPLSRLLIDRNLGIPSIDANVQTIMQTLEGIFAEGVNNSGFHGNMTKMQALEGLGGGIVWVDQNRPIFNLPPAEAARYADIGAETNITNTRMVKLRYMMEGMSGYKSDISFDTQMAQVNMPMIELARMIMDPNHKPRYYTDFGGTHLAPTKNKDAHIENTTVEFTKTSSDYQRTQLKLSRYKDGSYLTSAIMTELFSDGKTILLDREIPIEFENHDGDMVDGKLIAMDLGSRRVPVVVETMLLEGVEKPDGSFHPPKEVDYHYPIEGEIATIKFKDEVPIEKAKGINGGEEVLHYRHKREVLDDARGREVTAVGDEDIAVVPSDTDIPVKITTEKSTDGADNVRAAIETGFFEAQSTNPEHSMVFYGDPGNIAIPTTKNVWIREDKTNVRDATNALIQRDAKIAGDGNASLRILNLAFKTKKGFGSNKKMSQSIIDKFLDDLQKNNKGVVAVAHTKAGMPEALKDALSDAGLTQSGTLSKGNLTHTVFDAHTKANPSPYKTSGELGDLIKNRLEAVDAQKPTEFDAGDTEIIPDVSMAESHVRTKDSFFNLQGYESFTSVHVMDEVAELIKSDPNPPEKGYIIRTSKNVGTQVIDFKKSTKKGLLNFAEEVSQNTMVNIKGSVDNKPVALNTLSEDFLAKLAGSLGVTPDAIGSFISSVQTKQKGTKNSLGIAMDENMNIIEAKVLTPGKFKMDPASIKKRFGGKAIVVPEGQTITNTKGKKIIDARIPETEINPVEVGIEVYRATKSDPKARLNTLPKLKSLMDGMNELQKIYEDVTPEGELGDSRVFKTAGALLGDPKISDAVMRFFKGESNAAFEVRDIVNQMANELEAAGKSAELIRVAEGEIAQLLIGSRTPIGFDQTIAGLSKGIKAKKPMTRIKSFNESYLNSNEVNDAGIDAGYEFFSDILGSDVKKAKSTMKIEDGFIDDKTDFMDIFAKSLFPAVDLMGNSDKYKAHRLFLQNTTDLYMHYTGRIAQSIEDATGEALSQVDKQIVAEVAVDFLANKIDNPTWELNAETMKAVLDGKEAGNLQSQKGFASGKTMGVLGVGAVLGSLLAAKVIPMMYESDGQLEDEDDELLSAGEEDMRWYGRNSIATWAVGIATGVSIIGGGLKLTRSRYNPTVGDGLSNALRATAHKYQGSVYGKYFGKTSVLQYLKTAQPGTLKYKLGRSLGIADNTSQQATAEFSMIMNKAMAKKTTASERGEYVSLIDNLSNLSDKYGAKGMGLEDRMKNAFADLLDYAEGRYSEADLNSATHVLHYIEKTRDVGRIANLKDENGSTRSRYSFNSKELDKEAIISSFHVGDGLGSNMIGRINTAKIPDLLDRGIVDAERQGYSFTDDQVASIILNDYGAAGGETFGQVKKALAKELQKRAGDSRLTIDTYLDKLGVIPKTPAQTIAYLNNQSRPGTHAHAASPTLDIYNAVNESTPRGLIEGFDRMAKQVYYGKEMGMETGYLISEVAKDMKPDMREELFDAIRMDAGTNYLARVEDGSVKQGTNANSTEMAKYSNNAWLRNFQVFQAMSKLSSSIKQGPAEFIASTTQTAIVHGFGKTAKGLIDVLFREMDFETYTAMKNFNDNVHSSAADEGFARGSRAMVARFGENSKASTYDIVRNLTGSDRIVNNKVVSTKWAKALDGVFGDLANKPVVMKNKKMAALFGYEVGQSIPMKDLKQGHTGLGQIYRAFNTAGAMVAYKVSKETFSDVSSKYALKGEAGLKPSEIRWMKETFNDEDLAYLRNPSADKIIDEDMQAKLGMKYAINGVQGITGISKSATQNLRASSSDFGRWATTFKKAPGNVFHSTWNNVIMPAFEGDTAPLSRMIVASGLFAPYMLTNLNALLGLEEDKDVALQDSSAFHQKLTWALSNMSMAIPFNAFLAVSGYIDNPDKGTTLINTIRSVSGSNPATMANIGKMVGGLGIDASRGDAEGAMMTISDFVKSEFKPYKEADAFTRNAFNDGIAVPYNPDEGVFSYISKNFAKKEWNASLEFPAFLYTSDMAYKLFQHRSKQVNNGEYDYPEEEALQTRQRHLDSKVDELTGENQYPAKNNASRVRKANRQATKTSRDRIIQDERGWGSTK